jgi:hypothetical protein
VLADEELGLALHDALVALVGNVEPSPDLVERVLGDPGPGRVSRSLRSGRRWLVAVPVALAGALATTIVFLAGSGVTPSFAVTSFSDGSVEVTIDDLTGVSGANARLHQLGVRAVVVPISPTCTTKTDLTYIGIDEHPAPSTRLIPSEIPAGTTVVLAASQIGPNKIEMAIGRVTGTPPSCVAPGTVGPGLSPSVGQEAPQP